ncbi:MAG: hypothetical protein LBQ39_03580 [Tannerellaceae bacterium]|jgi:hypothetical protein|nr:hypothetical protein [Tannerellaceae bacterium]
MNKIDKFFSSFTLRLAEKYPRKTKLYLYADYFELVALFNGNISVSISDMLDRLHDEDIIRLIIEDEDIDFNNQSLVNDTEEAFVKEVFDLIRQRDSFFSNDYPFYYLNLSISLKTHLSEKQKLYIFLLLASNLNLFNEFQSELTKEFELLSREALKNYLPDFAIVKSFGKNAEFQGYVYDKIKKLAELMNVNIDEDYLNTISQQGTQDLGLDVVGWLPLKDNIGNFISVFGQCACGKEWNKKLNETRRYNKFLKIYLSEISHSLFIPYSLVNYNDLTFYEHHEFGEAILVFERHRILSLIKNDNIFNSFNSNELVEKCINYSEDII